MIIFREECVKNIAKKVIVLFASVVCLTSSHAIDLSVGQGKVAAKPIVVVPFSGNSSKDKIDFIVSSDLKQSGVFAPISPKAYQARPTSGSQIDYSVFQNLGAAYVVVGKQEGSNAIRFDIVDTFQQRLVGSYSVALGSKSLRQSAHVVSDTILEKLTGIRGAFATRLVYIHEKGKGASRRYQVVISDSDGGNPVTLLSSRAPVMSPRFSPNGKSLAYVTFEGQHAQIVTHDIATGRRSLVSKEKGVNSAPAWSPNGSRIAMVLSRDGNPEIYFKDLSTGKLTRVTNNPAIDTEPVWGARGRFIYFTSDRSGAPQLYRIDIGTGAVARVTKSGAYNAGADVSADGKKIALVRKVGKQFIVGTVDSSGGQFFGVSKGFVDETPRFSPNGKMLVFTSMANGKAVLKVVNTDGSGSNTLSSHGHVRDPDWSAYIR